MSCGPIEAIREASDSSDDAWLPEQRSVGALPAAVALVRAVL